MSTHKNVLFVGQAPGEKGAAPFVGRSGKTVARLLGEDYQVMLQRHGFINVVEEFQGKSGKGDKFKPKPAEAIARITEASAKHAGIVLCGKAVAKSVGCRKQPYLDAFELAGKPAMVLPHPSGINMWWNDASKKRSAQKRLRAFVSRVTA